MDLIPYVDDAWNFFHSEVLQVKDKHAPWASVKVKGRQLPWVAGDLIHLFKQRDKAWERYHVTKDLADWIEFKRLRKVCTVNKKCHI